MWTGHEMKNLRREALNQGSSGGDFLLRPLWTALSHHFFSPPCCRFSVSPSCPLEHLLFLTYLCPVRPLGLEKSEKINISAAYKRNKQADPWGRLLENLRIARKTFPSLGCSSHHLRIIRSRSATRLRPGLRASRARCAHEPRAAWRSRGIVSPRGCRPDPAHNARA